VTQPYASSFGASASEPESDEQGLSIFESMGKSRLWRPSLQVPAPVLQICLGRNSSPPGDHRLASRTQPGPSQVLRSESACPNFRTRPKAEKPKHVSRAHLRIPYPHPACHRVVRSCGLLAHGSGNTNLDFCVLVARRPHSAPHQRLSSPNDRV
jgi:hypothetical protein